MTKQSKTEDKKQASKSEKFEPTKMSWAVSAAAASLLALLGVITIYSA